MRPYSLLTEFAIDVIFHPARGFPNVCIKTPGSDSTLSWKRLRRCNVTILFSFEYSQRNCVLISFCHGIEFLLRWLMTGHAHQRCACWVSLDAKECHLRIGAYSLGEWSRRQRWGWHVPVTTPSHDARRLFRGHCSTASDCKGSNSVQKSCFLVENISCLNEQNTCNTDQPSVLRFLSYFPEKGINGAQSMIHTCAI